MGQGRAMAAVIVALLAACGSDASDTSPGTEPTTAASVTQLATAPSVTRRPAPTATSTPSPTQARLTAEFAGLTYFDIHPDGAITALLVGENGSTSELITLDASEAFGSVYSPAWSPDGTMLAFAVGPGIGPGSHAIWVVSADGGEPRELPVSGLVVDWSPDSRSVLVRQLVDGVVPPGAVPHWIVDVGTAEVRELHLSSVTEWLPDGSFLGSSPVDGREAVVVGSPAGEQTALFVGSEPRLSPSGDRIAFTRFTATGEPQLGLASRDGSGLTIVGPGSLVTWSPDGRQLAYLESATDASGGWQLAIASASGERMGALPIADPLPVVWSPDGSFLVAWTGEEAGGELMLITLGTESVVPLTTGAFPVWRLGPTR